MADVTPQKTITRLLIANRGEIAVRIIRDLRPNDQVLVHNYMVGTN